jgi:hypothetical protein
MVGAIDETDCRNEIATCLERAYPTLPISDCQTLLFFPAQNSVPFKAFADAVLSSCYMY